MANDLSPIHPELREMWKFFPRLTFNRWSAPLFHWLTGLQPKPKAPAGVVVEQSFTRSLDGKTEIRLRVYKPGNLTVPVPVLVWMHGGGYLVGLPEQDDVFAFEVVQELGMAIVSVDYRLAPRHPFPTPLDDCYSALEWVHANAQRLGIDPHRIAIGGASAGGGLAATLAQLALDRGKVKPVFQLLVYPMLDDRTVLRTPVPHADLLTWNQASNRYGWESYLDQPCGLETAPPYAVAARRDDLTGLPPAWVGVGTLDLFHDEDVAYAQRLQGCGVDCELVLVQGAFHGFDVLAANVELIREFRRSQLAALKKYLFA